MQKRVFTVWNEFSLDWLCVARLTRLLLIVETCASITNEYTIMAASLYIVGVT